MFYFVSTLCCTKRKPRSGVKSWAYKCIQLSANPLLTFKLPQNQTDRFCICLKSSLTCESMKIKLLQFLAGLVVFAWALVERWFQKLPPDLLDNRAAVCIEEDDYGIALGVVKLLYCIWCDVQQTVLALQGKMSKVISHIECNKIHVLLWLWMHRNKLSQIININNFDRLTSL